MRASGFKEKPKQKFTSKSLGRLSLTIGILMATAVVLLIIFFIGYFNQIEWMYVFGTSNDVLNLTTSILTCIMAAVLLPSPRRQPLVFIVFLILTAATWIGAAIVTVDSLMMGGLMSNLTFHTLRLKYGLGFVTSHDIHFGDGLVGLWVMAVNIYAYTKHLWPRRITVLGIVSGALYTLGLFGLQSGSFGAFGQIAWNIQLSRWILRNTSPDEAVAA
jgi:hypothetical protein